MVMNMVLPRRKEESGLFDGVTFIDTLTTNNSTPTINFGNTGSGAVYYVCAQTVTGGGSSSSISVNSSYPSNYYSATRCTVTKYGNGVFKVTTTGPSASLAFSISGGKTRLTATWLKKA